MAEDYIMRQIEEFGRGLARAIHLKVIDQYENALDELNNLLLKMVGFDLKQIKMLGLGGIKNFFDPNNYSTVEKVFYSAKVLKEESLILLDMNMLDESKRSMESALALFELLKENEIYDLPGLDEEIKSIKNKV